ncbi:MAG: roadblock/LC7 domain-containing protein [Gemmatimonadota bacterium]
MNDTVKRAVDALTRVDGVRAAMVVDAEAGVPVASQVATGVQETALAAMSGALFTRTAYAMSTAGYGRVDVVQLEAEGGHVVMAGAGPLLVVALTEPDAGVGLVRVQTRRAARELTG